MEFYDGNKKFGHGLAQIDTDKKRLRMINLSQKLI
jgi:hypothetical protein